ncbi:DNA sulfur modification protein DndD [Nonomuraea dietziae]
MLLHKITLTDFGAYQGEQFLNLKTRPGRPIILIGGLNGCGKTTLLDAIQLVLYGARARTSGRGNRSYENYLRESINRQADPKHAHIVLEFSTIVEGEERLYKVRRSWEVNGKTVREFLTVLINGELDLVISDNWADHIEDLLPLEAASLFFFDGEKIESLADPDRAAPVIESAVYALLGVNTVEQLRTDLLALQRRQKISEEDKQILKKIHDLEKQIEEARQVSADIKQKQAGLSEQILQAQDIFDKADESFASAGGSLYEQRAELEAEENQLREQLKNVSDSLASNTAAGPLPLLLLSEQITSVKQQVDKEHAAMQAAQVLDTLSQRDHQLLSSISNVIPADGLAAIERFLNEDRRERAVDAEIPRVLNFPSDALTQLASIKEVLQGEAARARELVAEAMRLRERLNLVERKLAGVPDKQTIAERIVARDNARDHVTLLVGALQRLDEERDTVLRRIDLLNADRERAYKGRAQKVAETEHAARIITYADRMRSTLEKFGEALLQRHISRLEVAVLDSFNRLMRKNGLVSDLRIDIEKFMITLVGPDDNELDPARLSAGERQLLAVSLLWGLARVAGNHLPSVIDTPLGRLDSRHREHLVQRYFPHASHQVLLLSTDEEIDEYLFSKLRPSIAHTYTLVHDDTTFTTTVEPGYWWTAGAPHVA